jgi:predicted hydrocarbon binding protein
MPEKFDFERYWLAKFAECLDQVSGEKIRREVMKGSEGLTSQSSRQDVIGWSKQAMERLDGLVDEEKRKTIMTGCACQYSKDSLRAMRDTYAATKDIEKAHAMLQEQFESFLRNSLELSEEMIREIVNRGWGAAGIKRDNIILATKIPKSGYLVEYMNETDPERRRQIYCHCPRIRDVLETSETISATYCYCGAGFYKGIWEEILQQPVEVEVLESVLKGDEVCKIAIHLPAA